MMPYRSTNISLKMMYTKAKGTLPESPYLAAFCSTARERQSIHTDEIARMRRCPPPGMPSEMTCRQKTGGGDVLGRYPTSGWYFAR